MSETKQATKVGAPPHIQFISAGFIQDAGSRVFAYEGIGKDHVRIRCTVRADLALSRKFGIRLQELPLICLAILERSVEMGKTGGVATGREQRSLTFTEEAMCIYAVECMAVRDAATLKRRLVRRQPAKSSAALAAFIPHGGISPATGKTDWRNR